MSARAVRAIARYIVYACDDAQTQTSVVPLTWRANSGARTMDIDRLIGYAVFMECFSSPASGQKNGRRVVSGSDGAANGGRFL
jgi:hypothetical protein